MTRFMKRICAVAMAAASALSGNLVASVSPTNEWQDVPPTTTLAEVASELGLVTQDEISGVTGADIANFTSGDAYIWRGDYDAQTAYQAGDVVYNPAVPGFQRYTGSEWEPVADGIGKLAQLSSASNATLVATIMQTAPGGGDEDLSLYYPDGSVKSKSEITDSLLYDWAHADESNRTVSVLPFCNTGTATNDNSSLVGRVVIPPFVDADSNPYISDDGTRFKVVEVRYGSPDDKNGNLTAIVAPNTVTNIGNQAFYYCSSLSSVSLPSASTIGDAAFDSCDALTSVSLPLATTLGVSVFGVCSSLDSVSLPTASDIRDEAFFGCTSLSSVDFGDTPRSSVPSLGENAFSEVPTSCKIIVPDEQYDAWTAASGWSTLVTRGYKFLSHSEWEYARRYELNEVNKALTEHTTNTAIHVTAAEKAAWNGKRDYNDRSWPISVSNVLSRYDWVCTDIDGDGPDPVPAFTSLRVGDVLESNASASSWGTNSDARLNFSGGQWTYNDDDSLRIRTTGGGSWADTTKLNIISDDPFVFLVLSRTNLTYDPVTNYTTFVVETELDAATNAVYSSITNLSHDVITNLSHDATNLLYSQFVYGYPNSQWDGRYMIYTSADPSEFVFADFERENYAASCFRTPSDVPGSLFQIDIEPCDYSPTGMTVTVRNTHVGTVVGTGFISPETPYFEIENVLPPPEILHVSSFRSRFADPPPGNYAMVSNAAMNAVQTETDPVWNAEKSDYATIQALVDGEIVPHRATRADSAGFASNAAELGDRSATVILTQLDAAAETNALQSAMIESNRVNIASVGAGVESNRVDITSLQDTTATLSNTTATINSKIPSAASASNQLADKKWIDDQIDTYAAYYITYTAAGEAFPTHAALTNATVVYSGGAERTPTRNDYAVVLADESHGGQEWRYIYTVAAGATTGQWEAQYPIETNDYDGLSNKPQVNGISLTGNKTGADIGVLDLAGGTMTGGLTVPNLTVGSRKDGSTVGRNSVAEGEDTTASATYSHAEGGNTVASGVSSHAEGSNTTASGVSSHAEGYFAKALGRYTHAEGTDTIATNDYEHAQGRANASHKASTTFGDAGNTLSSIGFGTSNNARTNAVETMQDGKTYIYGLGGYDGTNPTSATDLASAVNAKASRALNPTAGNLAALDTNGNPVDSQIAKTNITTKTEFAAAATAATNYTDAAATASTNYTDAATNAIPRIKEEDIVWLYGYEGITNRVNSKGEMYTLEPPYGMWREYNKINGALVGEYYYKGWVTSFGGDYTWTNSFRYGSAISYNPVTGKISGDGYDLGKFTTNMNPETGTFVMPDPIVDSFKWVYVPSGGYSETYYDRYAKESELSAAATASTNYTDTALAAVSQSATNYTDATASALRDSIFTAAQSATNYTAAAATAATNYTDAATNAIPKFSEKDVVKVFYKEGENYPSYVDGRGEFWEIGEIELGGHWVATGGLESSQGTYNYTGLNEWGNYVWTHPVQDVVNYITYNPNSGEIVHNGSTSTNPPERGKNPEVIGTTFPTCYNIWTTGRTITYYPMDYQYDSKGRFALSNALSKVAFTGNYNDITNKPTFATVATSGSYNDLTDTPTIPVVPTDVSAFTNDAGYVTKSITNGLLSVSTASTTYTTKSENATKQDKLPYPTNAIPYAAISGTPSLATVATTGSYNDLSDTPDIPVIPTNVSAFSNDVGYVTESVTNGLLSTSTAAATYQPKGDYALVSAVAAAATASTNYTDYAAQSATNYTAAAALAATNYTDSTAADLRVSISGKADKVASATAGNLAALDANGNLTDSSNTVQGTFGCGELVVGYSPDQRYVDIIGQGAVSDHCTIIVYNSDLLSHYHYIALPNSDGADKESILALEREIAPAFDNTATYAEGALVYYNDALYRCITAVTSAGAWTGSTNWTAASVEDVLAALRTALAGKLNNTTDTMSGSLTVQGSLTVGSRKSGSAIGTQSTAEGKNTTASGLYSHAEGEANTASGPCSHAEGSSNTASGYYSHAEGIANRVGGTGSHAEGGNTTASGSYSHAEGNNTTAGGHYSHAEGNSTTAQNDYEHAQGRYNASHKANTTWGSAGNTLSSIGFGSGNNARTNAVETMQDGKTFIYGLGGYDGTNPTGSGVQDLASAVNAKIDKMVAIAWSDLKAKRDGGNLVPGQQYRITNYVATTSGDMDSQTANHPFDIIVVADSTTNLNEHARAAIHEGDSYFASCNLAAWDVWYCIDNDTSRFTWAVADGGKGVIYRLVDEFQNDVPYDFKGIQFKANGDTDDVWRYTFDSGDASDNTDLSKSGLASYVYKNTIATRLLFGSIRQLNCIVFKGAGCYANKFGLNCSNNTFGGNCYANTFGSDCNNNTFGTGCYANMFGLGCHSNTFGMNCSNNSFGVNCFLHTFGLNCSNNTIGGNCSNNIFGNYCNSSTFGMDCSRIKFGSSSTIASYCRYIRVASGNKYLYINPTGNTTASAYYQNVEIVEGVNNTTTYKPIEDPNVNQTFKTTYQPADSQVISL